MLILNCFKKVSRFLTLNKTIFLAFLLTGGSVIHNTWTSDKPTFLLFLCFILADIVMLNGCLRERFLEKEKQINEKEKYSN